MHWWDLLVIPGLSRLLAMFSTARGIEYWITGQLGDQIDQIHGASKILVISMTILVVMGRQVLLEPADTMNFCGR